MTVCNAVKLVCQVLSLRLVHRMGKILTVGDMRRTNWRSSAGFCQAFKMRVSIVLMCFLLVYIAITLSQALEGVNNAYLNVDFKSL